MAAWHEGSVEANGLQLHYIRTGTGEKPVLLLLHGLTDNGRYWSPTARAIEDRFDVVMLDQRGHGESARPPAGYSSEEMARDAAEAIRALGLAPVAVLGHSMGGSVGLALAATYPGLVARLLLLDPALALAAGQSAEVEEQRRERLEGWRRDVLALQQLSPAELEERCLAQHPRWGREDCGYWAESNLQVYPDALPLVGGQRPWQEHIARVRCPVLLIYGDRDLGSIVDDDLAAEVARLGADVRLAHIADAGHSIQREQFGAYMAAVRAFLAATG